VLASVFEAIQRGGNTIKMAQHQHDPRAYLARKACKDHHDNEIFLGTTDCTYLLVFAFDHATAS
jgi:hypothetical protein